MCVLFVLLTLSILSLCCGSKMHKISLSLSFHSLFSLAVSSNTNDDTNNSKRSSSSRAPLLLLSLSLLPIICTRNEYKNTLLMERFCFPQVTFNACSTNKEEVYSSRCKKRRRLLFVAQKPPLFVLRRVRRVRLEYPRTDLHPKCLSFHLLFRAACGDIFSPLQSAQ